MFLSATTFASAAAVTRFSALCVCVCVSGVHAYNTCSPAMYRECSQRNAHKMPRTHFSLSIAPRYRVEKARRRGDGDALRLVDPFVFIFVSKARVMIS